MKFDILIVVWGRWHLDTLAKVTGPTLMAPGNLPRLGATCSVRVRFFTTPEGAEALRAMPIVRAMKSCATVEIATRADSENITGHYHMMWWHDAARDAKDIGAHFVVVSPDSVWPSGVLGKLPDVFARPRVTCVAVPYLGVVSESFVPDIRHRFPGGDGAAITMTPREMIELGVRHLAPMTIVRVAGSPHTHPSLGGYWPVPGQGFVHRLTSRELFALDPARVELTQHFYGANIACSEEYYLAQDSDDMFMLSIGQLTKYVGELVPNRPLRDLDVAGSSIKPHNLSPLVWQTCNRPVRIKIRDDDPAAWTRAERESGKFMRRMLVTREMLLFREAMHANAAEGFARLLSMAIFVTDLVETWRYKRPVTVLAVSDKAMTMRGRNHAAALGRPGAEDRLLKAAKNHVIPGVVDLKRDSTVHTFGGSSLAVHGSERGDARVNGVKIARVVDVGENRLCVLDDFLYEDGLE